MTFWGYGLYRPLDQISMRIIEHHWFGVGNPLLSYEPVALPIRIRAGKSFVKKGPGGALHQVKGGQVLLQQRSRPSRHRQLHAVVRRIGEPYASARRHHQLRVPLKRLSAGFVCWRQREVFRRIGGGRRPAVITWRSEKPSSIMRRRMIVTFNGARCSARACWRT